MSKAERNPKCDAVTTIPTARAANRTAEQLKPYQFKPGQSGNPAGRKKGTRDALGQSFIQAMHDDFQAHGTDVIQQVRTERPHEYLKVIAGILPKELNVKKSDLEELSEDELVSLIDHVRSFLVSASAAALGGGTETASRH